MGVVFFPSCRPPFYLVVKKKVTAKSCFKSAQNRAASSLWIGGHRYAGILCASKLLWVSSDLKLKNLDFGEKICAFGPALGGFSIKNSFGAIEGLPTGYSLPDFQLI